MTEVTLVISAAPRAQFLHHVRAKKPRAASHNHALVAPEGWAVNPVVGHIVPRVSRFRLQVSGITFHASRITFHASRFTFQVHHLTTHYPLPTVSLFH